MYWLLKTSGYIGFQVHKWNDNQINYEPSTKKNITINISKYAPKIRANGKLLNFCWCCQIQTVTLVTKTECLRYPTKYESSHIKYLKWHVRKPFLYHTAFYCMYVFLSFAPHRSDNTHRFATFYELKQKRGAKIECEKHNTLSRYNK